MVLALSALGLFSAWSMSSLGLTVYSACKLRRRFAAQQMSLPSPGATNTRPRPATSLPVHRCPCARAVTVANFFAGLLYIPRFEYCARYLLDAWLFCIAQSIRDELVRRRFACGFCDV